jgi:hypothetical protein
MHEAAGSSLREIDRLGTAALLDPSLDPLKSVGSPFHRSDGDLAGAG